MATPQRPVFALALTQPKWVRVYVSEPDLGKIRPGMEARVVHRQPARQPVAGKVGYISSVAEFTPKSVQTEELRTSLVYEVRVLVDDPDDGCALGQPVTVADDGTERDDATAAHRRRRGPAQDLRRRRWAVSCAVNDVSMTHARAN
jgi:HlyD family secretion protein